MTNYKDYLIKAVGYIRVSTDKQAADVTAMEKQAERIRKACGRRDFSLLAIYEDTASGVDPRSAIRRKGLNEAVARARAEGAVLVIPEPTRLFRNVEAARDFFKTLDVPVFSVHQGRFMKPPALLRAIAKGEDVAHAIRKGTSDTMSSKVIEDFAFSDTEVRKKAAKASAKARAEKSQDIALQVVNILRSDPTYRALSNKALADLLNRRQILTGWKRSWTQNSARDVRRKAEEMIAEQDQIDNEVEVPETVVEAKPVSLPPIPGYSQEDSDLLRQNPNFDLFGTIS